MSIPARHFTRILTTCRPHRQRRQRAAPRRVCGRPQSPRPPVSIPARHAADVNLHATLHADPRARHAAGRSSRIPASRRRSSQILATWQAKVPWKEILLLLAAAMSTLRHVEPRLRKRSSSSAPSAQTPRGTTRCAAPRDSTLHTARRRPSRSHLQCCPRRNPTLGPLKALAAARASPPETPKSSYIRRKTFPH